MITLVRIELYKIFKKWRTYIGFIAIGVLVPLIQIAFMIEGERSLNFMTRNLQQSFIFTGNLLNGYFISYFVLGSLAIHIPFLVTLVSGDLLAGEATAGTYRLLITRPISRFQIVTAKFISSILYTIFLIFWLAAISLGLGILIFGVGELIVIGGSQIIIFPKAEIWWRFLLAYGYAMLSMSVVATLAYFFSSMVQNAIGPIITTMAIIIMFFVISAIQIDIFRALEPYLFTNYIMQWRLFFTDPLETSEILKSVLVLLAHIVVLYTATFLIFRRKDILS
jgi:ABC-2 type transport system permease protein